MAKRIGRQQEPQPGLDGAPEQQLLADAGRQAQDHGPADRHQAAKDVLGDPLHEVVAGRVHLLPGQVDAQVKGQQQDGDAGGSEQLLPRSGGADPGAPE